MATMKCSRCGSENIMTNLQVRVGVGEELEVEVRGDPNALVFKQTHREALRATVCGECGNVELSAENPGALWGIYNSQKNS